MATGHRRGSSSEQYLNGVEEAFGDAVGGASLQVASG